MPILPYRGIWPRIAPDAFIAPTAVVAGDVTIASRASVWFGAVIRGDAAPIAIGPDCDWAPYQRAGQLLYPCR